MKKENKILMCTALRYHTCMGRNYDYEKSYDEQVITLPKDYNGNKYHMIGIGTGLVEDYPLLYDAMNQQGLCCSALAFTGNAHYYDEIKGKNNIPPYDFVQHIVGNFRDVKSARDYLENANVINKSFSEDFPNSDLHWFICDKKESIVVESTKGGLNVYDNPYDVLTNNPPFPKQVIHMEENGKIIGNFDYEDIYGCSSRGVETYGLLGDTTSTSRFSRVHYYLEQMDKPKYKLCYDDVSAFHLLDTVKQTWGATPVGKDYEYTIYSAVYDMETLELSVRTYVNTRVQRFVMSNRVRRYNL